ncbi:MAG: hypothetical protein KF857_08195 [Fimbriimonadaceae bacterium]|nr:hypothetical protein [Fimbriimonadaceae bacterium]
MDADDATIGIIHTRRDVLRWAISAGAVAAFPAHALALLQEADKKQTGLIASPELTEGPFFVDEKLNRSDLRGDRKREGVANGKLFDLEVKVLKLVGTSFVPLAAAQVDLWHCDTGGKYSDIDSPMNYEDTSGQKWLRGHQVTDDKGLTRFRTIVPGWYPGRAPHIHFKVRKFHEASERTVELTSQMFFKPDQIKQVYSQAPYNARGQRYTTNKMDGIYNERAEGGGRAGDQLLLDLSAKGEGYKSPFTIVLTDKNFRERRRGGDIDWASF